MARKFPFFLFTFLLLSSFKVLAFTVMPTLFEDAVSRAHLIFKGTVIDRAIEDDAYESKKRVIYYKFQIEECLKGICGTTYLFKQGKNVPGYEMGKTYLLFLSEENSRTGLVSPVGVSEGVYELTLKDEKWFMTQPSPKAKSGDEPTNNYDIFKERILKQLKN
ncbi:MAG TPA: hypothetical protein DDW49_02650 [Deltaproteobacteria bacterium]|nr:MAG: hypothetical protein A2048_09845 [Deltaproteobacteria bacterium GWA2_45_12]HBF12278.1 hypothetical protein [Deltaproteobacteria bacterium]